MNGIRKIKTIVTRELYSYLGSPVAYVFIFFFLVLTGFFTFMLGNYFQRNDTSLEPFFLWHPWLYMFLVPAIGMRMWAEERRSGTVELLFTMPITQWHAIIGKYIAGCIMLALALFCTFPMVITSYYLGKGNPDGGVIVCGYLGSLLVAMAFLAVSSLTSSLTRNQVVSFILGLVVCLLLILAGWPPVTDLFRRGEAVPLFGNFAVSYLITWVVLILFILAAKKVLVKAMQAVGVWPIALLVTIVSAAICVTLFYLFLPILTKLGTTPTWVVDLVASFSITPQYERLKIGIIDLRTVVYFLSIITFGLFSTGVVLQKRRGA